MVTFISTEMINDKVNEKLLCLTTYISSATNETVPEYVQKLKYTAMFKCSQHFYSK